MIIIEDEEEDMRGCAACLSKKRSVGETAPGQTSTVIIDESDDWEFLSMYWWSRWDR